MLPKFSLPELSVSESGALMAARRFCSVAKVELGVSLAPFWIAGASAAARQRQMRTEGALLAGNA